MAKDLPQSIEWEFLEHTQPQRGGKWYLLTSLVLFGLIIYALLTTNFLFALIIVMFGIIIFINQRRQPQQIKFVIDSRGIKVGEKSYSYNELDNFWIIYQPPHVKTLYFNFKSSLRPRLAISLEKQNPLEVKAFLRQYLEEDLEQEEEPLSDILGRLFKIL